MGIFKYLFYIYEDFKKLNFKRKIQVVVIITWTLFLFDKYNEIYLNQVVPVKVITFFNDFPLPQEKTAEFTVNDYMKTSVLNISIKAEDKNGEYQTQINNYLHISEFQKVSDGNYKNGERIVYVKKENGKLEVRLEVQQK